MVKLDNLNGFNEYQRALKIISGEEVSPIKDENQVQDQKPENQVVSNNTLDQIDPLFTQALNAPSIQMIKESD